MMPGSNPRSYRSIGLSLGILLTAVFVFLRSGADESFGPLDRDAANGLFLGLWIVAPIAGGLAARMTANRQLASVALGLGIVVGLALTLFPTSGTGQYTCWLELPAVPMGYLLGRLAVGSLVGVGMGIAFLVTGVAARRRATAVPGIILAAAANFGGSLAAYELFYGGVRCLN